jgi:predicted enzyme related to lactoylglutathione lyase
MNMSRIIALACVVTILAPPAFAEDPRDPYTLDDVAFMAGTWHTEWHGSDLEEHFSRPAGGTMMGMFRWMTDGATRLTEHMVIEQRDDGVHLFLRHFNAGAEPWEQEQEGAMHMVLTHAADDRCVFTDESRAFPRTITYHRSGSELVSHLEGKGEDGAKREMQFNFRSNDMTTTTETLTAAGQKMGYNGGLTISIQVSDISKSIQWYQDVAGFKLMYHLEDMGWCELSTGVNNVNVGLSQVEKPKVGGPVPTFGVNDIDHARKLLEDKGVRFDGETMEIPGMVKLATWFDPDGNAFMLFQSLSDQVPQ